MIFPLGGRCQQTLPTAIAGGGILANCFGKRTEVISLPVIVEGGDSYNAFWRMPFRY